MGWTAPVTHAVNDLIGPVDWNDEITGNMRCIIAGASTAVAALNTTWGATVPDGAIGRVKVGTSPFDFVDLRYDASLAKWVSQAVVIPMTGGANDNTYSSTVIKEFAHIGRVNTGLPWKPYDTAGLKPQFRLTGSVGFDAAGSASSFLFYPGYRTANIGDSAWVTDTSHVTGYGGTTILMFGSTGGAFNVQDTGWQNIDAGYTPTDLISPTTVLAKITGTSTLSFLFVDGAMQFRWSG